MPGLGLSIALKPWKHTRRIAATSRQGLVFRLELPCAEAQSCRHAARDTLKSASWRKGRGTRGANIRA